MKGRRGCVRNFGYEHDFCQAEKAAHTDPRTNSAVKYATARGHLILETGIGGVKSPKIRGVKILNFRGSRNLTLFYRNSKETPQFGSQKSKLSKDNFRGEFPPL